MQRLGIFAGSFDPIHIGHLEFALSSLKNLKLEKVIFLPERSPLSKPGAEHFAHRQAMIKQAIKPHKQLESLELPEKHFTSSQTLSHLKQRYPKAIFYFLIGSDSVKTMATTAWTDKSLSKYFSTGNLVVALRQGDTEQNVKDILISLPSQPSELVIIPSPARDVNSTDIREALSKNKKTKGLLPSVYRYSKNQWLYVSLSKG